MTLEELLTPELYAQVQQAIDAKNAGVSDRTKHIRFADLSEGGYVSAEKYNSKVNGLTAQVTDLQTQLTSRDTDITDLQGKLTAAQADGTKLADAQTALTALQNKYAADQTAWTQRIARQEYEFAVREKANGIRFSSPAAKRDFIREANEKNFQRDGEKLLGYDDFVASYKAENPGAVLEDNPTPPAPPAPQVIVPPTNNPPAPDPNGFSFHFAGVRPRPTSNQ